MKSFKVAVCQTKVFLDKALTLQNVRTNIEKAVGNNANIVVLGETFNSLYTKEFLVPNAEDFNDSQTLNMLKECSSEYGIWIFGTIPEVENNNYYNTAFAINQGYIKSKYRKMHLFDIDIPDQNVYYKESDTFKAGNTVNVIDTEYCRIGLAICYDLRFPELAMAMRDKGAELLIYPASFTQVTGKQYLELLLRSRAVDNQLHVVSSCVARYTDDIKLYQAYGNSMIINPMGDVLQKAGDEETIIYQDIDLKLNSKVRQNIPISQQKRFDIYQKVSMQQQIFRVNKDEVYVLICDMQDIFKTTISTFQSVNTICSMLIQSANIFKQPVLLTEYKTNVFGHTDQEIMNHFQPDEHLKYSKTSFSMISQQVKEQILKSGKNTIVLAGIEAHACIQQTTYDLLQLGLNVVLLDDGITSARLEDKRCAMEQMKGQGAHVFTIEGYLFELMRDYTIPEFKETLKIIKTKR